MANPLLNQVSNRNFMSPIGFKLKINKCPKVDFLATGCNLPGVTLGTAIQSTYLKDIDVPGDKLIYEDFRVNFIVDENMENYSQIYNWMKGLGFPESQKQFVDLRKDDVYYPSTTDADNPFAEFSDGTLIILNSNLRPQAHVKLEGMFPVSLTGLDFNATDTDVNYFTASVTFKYLYFKLTDAENNEL
jgi:hypothetical protein